MTQITAKDKSKEKFYQALLQIKSEGLDYRTLTVQQLASYAGLSRQTFYRHYQDKDEIITSRIHEFKLNALHHFTQTSKLDAQSMISFLLSYWDNHREFFALIEWSGLREVFIDNVAFMNREIMKMNNVVHLNETYISNTYAGAIYMFLVSFLSDEHRHTNIETLIQLFLTLTNGQKLLFK